MKPVRYVRQNLEAFFRDGLSRLPRGPVEPTTLALSWNISNISGDGSDDSDDSGHGLGLGNGSRVGFLLAPCGVRASNVLVRGVPGFVQLGRPLQFELTLSHNYPCHKPAERNVAAATIVFHARIDMCLVRKKQKQSRESQELVHATLRLAPPSTAKTNGNNSGDIVIVTVALPTDFQMGDEVVINGVSFAGQAVSGTVGETDAEEHVLPFVPVRLPVVASMHAPLQLKGAANDYRQTPVIAPNGTLYAPKWASSDVLVFAADGTPLPPLPLAGFGLSDATRSAAFVEFTNTLLLADTNEKGNASKLVAVDAASMAVCWSTALESSCYGIAVLPAQGVAVASECSAGQLHVHRLSDGTRIASAGAPALFPLFVAADAAANPYAGHVYVSSINIPGNVYAFCWNGAALVFDGCFDHASIFSHAPLAVMPPFQGKRTSFLVVGRFNFGYLAVFSLPDRRLVYTHELEGMQIMGLAADPSGTALAVCDSSSKAIHVLRWPLPGMYNKQTDNA